MFEILFGVIAGIVSGTGMGGGTILIFLLSMFMGIEQHTAQAINLVFFIPTSISAIIINFKNKNIDLKLALIISFFGVIGAILGSIISMNMDMKILKKAFGVFLGAVTIYEIYHIKSIKNKNNEIIKTKSEY
jgi:hypothetical protein